MTDRTLNLTKILNRYSKEQNHQAVDELGRAIYSELRRIAGYQLHKEYNNNSWQPTALANEAFLRLFRGRLPNFENRQHFYNIAARVMRHILIDRARRRNANKRKDAKTVDLGQADLVPHQGGGQELNLIELDIALKKLASIDERLSKIVELRYFLGLNLAETAKAIGCSTGTVKRDWVKARAWLVEELAA